MIEMNNIITKVVVIFEFIFEKEFYWKWKVFKSISQMALIVLHLSTLVLKLPCVLYVC